MGHQFFSVGIDYRIYVRVARIYKYHGNCDECISVSKLRKWKIENSEGVKIDFRYRKPFNGFDPMKDSNFQINSYKSLTE